MLRCLLNLDLKAIVIEGKPAEDKWYILLLKTDKAELLPADEYVGLNNYELTDKLQRHYGDNIGIASIGVAGERQYRNSTVQITGSNKYPSRAAARGGLGAVMGSKRIKAVVVDVRGQFTPVYADKQRFITASRNYVKGIKDNPVSGQAMPALGTAVLLNIVNAMGALPTRNYSSSSFEYAENKWATLQRSKTREKERQGMLATPAVLSAVQIYTRRKRTIPHIRIRIRDSGHGRFQLWNFRP